MIRRFGMMTQCTSVLKSQEKGLLKMSAPEVIVLEIPDQGKEQVFVEKICDNIQGNQGVLNLKQSTLEHKALSCNRLTEHSFGADMHTSCLTYTHNGRMLDK
jgi:hypothetical protein